jgi:hypothetical protein
MPGLIIVTAQNKNKEEVATVAHAFYCLPNTIDPRGQRGQEVQR